MTKTADTNKDSAGPGGPVSRLASLKFRLQSLLLLVALPAAVIIVVLGFLERQRVLETYRQEANRVTTQLVLRQTNLINDTRSFLMDLAQTSVVRSPSDPACSAFLAQLLPLKPQFVNIGVPRANGDLLCNAKPISKPVNVSDRPYIRRAMDDAVFSVGSFQRDRAAQVVSVNFAYPVKSSADSTDLVGAAVVVVSLDWWSQALADESLPDEAVALITDSEGQVIAIFPNHPDLIGRTVREIGFTKDQLATGSGEFFTQLGSVKRVFSHQTLFSSPDQGNVQMSLGIPVDIGLEQAARQAVVRLASFGGALLVAWLIALRLLNRGILRPLNILNREIHQLENVATKDGNPERNRADQLGDIGLMAQSFRKISAEQKMAEDAKKRQADHLEALFEAIPDNYFRIDKDGGILDYRIHLKLSLMQDPIAYYGHSIADLWPPETRQELKDNIRKLKETRDFVSWDYELDVDGIRQVREARLCPISGTDETILLLRDITQRRLAEEQRAQTEARIQRIITNLPGVVLSRRIMKSKTMEVLYISPQCKSIYGYTDQEIYADNTILAKVIDAATNRKIAELVRKAADELEPYSHRFQVTTQSGEVKWLESNTCAYLLADGTVLADGFVMDVTSEVVAQQQLAKERDVVLHAQKLESIGQMTGGVAHDFNNLLAAVMGSLELLRDDLSDVEHLALIDAGISASRRGAELTRNMLAFARRARLEPRVIDLNKMVNEMRNWAGRALPSNIEIETSLMAGLWVTKADISSTESALLNLIVNSRDAMPEGGRLTIETSNVHIDKDDSNTREEAIEPGRYVVLAVSDTGHGMSKETLDHIYEPFFTTKPTGAGSGLGLPMIMGFMQQSGGTVRVTSKPDVGTTFKLYFKATEDEVAAAVEPTQVEKRQSSGQEILVAEDEKTVRTVLVATLKKAGYLVTGASSGDEALALFKAKPTFDILLTDMVMPGALQGLSLSRAIREIAPELPVVFMSGYTNDVTIQGHGLEQEDTRLMKPIMRADLLEAIDKSLGR